MSYEGYIRILCKAGHQSVCDCYDDPVFSEKDVSEDQEIWRCDCGETAAWWQAIDQTNGSFCPAWQDGMCVDVCPEDYEGEYSSCDEEQLANCKKTGGRIDGYFDLEILTEIERSTCEHCGCTKVIKQRTYKVPENVGHKVE